MLLWFLVNAEELTEFGVCVPPVAASFKFCVWLRRQINYKLKNKKKCKYNK